ncbi:MAG: hypothetical protein HDS06_05360 [Bacteroides sp.]|nr:hypothetical protein [Bacteroides sp.]
MTRAISIVVAVSPVPIVTLKNAITALRTRNGVNRSAKTRLLSDIRPINPHEQIAIMIHCPATITQDRKPFIGNDDSSAVITVKE